MSKVTFEAWWPTMLFEVGVGQVVICRHKSNDNTEVGVFLVDTMCLGVKSAFFTRTLRSQLQELLERVFSKEKHESISPACARKLVEGAVAYAGRLGLAPHPDYKHACHVLGGLEASICERTFTFGHGGKPLYCQGPHDSPSFIDRVLNALRASCGEDGFLYILGGPISELDDDGLEKEEAE